MGGISIYIYLIFESIFFIVLIMMCYKFHPKAIESYISDNKLKKEIKDNYSNKLNISTEEFFIYIKKYLKKINNQCIWIKNIIKIFIICRIIISFIFFGIIGVCSGIIAYITSLSILLLINEEETKIKDKYLTEEFINEFVRNDINELCKEWGYLKN